MTAASVRVDVVPATVEHVDALIEGDEAFTARFGLRVEPGSMEFPEPHEHTRVAALEHTRAVLREGAPAEWGSHLLVDPAAGALVGFGGYKGAPRDGVVEIGYAVAPGYRGRGVATAAAVELIERARTAGVRRVLAHTLAEPNASTRVLQHCGMRRTAEIVDPNDGLVWRWELLL